jgi:hypothetical protein
MLTDLQPWLESLNMTIPKSYAANGKMFQWSEWQNFGWINVWGLKPKYSNTSANEDNSFRGHIC